MRQKLGEEHQISPFEQKNAYIGPKRPFLHGKAARHAAQ